MAVEIENRVREKLGVVARTPSVAEAAATAAAPKAASSKASKAVAAEPDSDDDL